VIWILLACTTGSDLEPRDLTATSTTLWAQGDWYDLGQVAILMTTSGSIDCEEFMEPLEVYEDPLSTLYKDDGTFHRLVWERIPVPTEDTGLEDTGLVPDATFPGFEGLWTPAGDGPGWHSTLDSMTFHDGQITAALASESWLDLDQIPDGGPVQGSFSTGHVTAAFQADDCGELIAYRVF
jgi:hypothetical protein